MFDRVESICKAMRCRLNKEKIHTAKDQNGLYSINFPTIMRLTFHFSAGMYWKVTCVTTKELSYIKQIKLELCKCCYATLNSKKKKIVVETLVLVNLLLILLSISINTKIQRFLSCWIFDDIYISNVHQMSPSLSHTFSLTFSTTSPSWMLPSLAARLSGEMSLTKMWLAKRRPYSAYKVNDSNKNNVSTEFTWPHRTDHTLLSSQCSHWD